MKETALIKSNATKFTIYLPFDKAEEHDAGEIRNNVLGFVKKVFGGATVHGAQGSTEKWGEESTCVLEILVEDIKNKETRIEQLAWLILCYLDNLKSRKGGGREETVWFYEYPVTLYKLNNPDLTTSLKQGGE